MVWINDHMYTHGACQCAWGGVKHSGVGRTHSKFGFYECVNVKHRAWEPARIARLLVASLRRVAREGDGSAATCSTGARRSARGRCGGIGPLCGWGG